jgi:hypothetical protein
MAADIRDREVLIHRTALHFSDFPPSVAGHYGDWAPMVMAGSSVSPDDGTRRASVILARAQRRDVLPNSLGAQPVRGHRGVIDGGLRYRLVTLAAGGDSRRGRLPCLVWRVALVPAGNPAPAAAVVAERAAAWQAAASPRCPAGGLCSAVPDVRISQTSSSYEPTRLTTGQAATTAPTRPRDQPWAMFAVRVAAIPRPSSQRAKEGTGTRCRAAYSATLPGRTSEWGRYESAPVTEGAVLHNGAGGRAFAAIGDLRLVDCRAAGRASR